MTTDHSTEFLPQFHRIRSIVEAALPSMSDLERQVMIMRFAIGVDLHSLQEAGDKLGISRVEVRQTEARLLQRLLASTEP
jgi:DNA-directed RNA polymerase specialized sigma subunit